LISSSKVYKTFDLQWQSLWSLSSFHPLWSLLRSFHSIKVNWGNLSFLLLVDFSGFFLYSYVALFQVIGTIYMESDFTNSHRNIDRKYSYWSDLSVQNSIYIQFLYSSTVKPV
jgi:hypothetical protein